MNGCWLVFEPLDTVAIRDGRAFDAGVQHTARAIAPQPSTVAGASTPALGAMPGAVAGPVTVRWDTYRRAWAPLFPVPRDVVADGDRLVRLTPPDTAGTATTEHDLAGEVGVLSGSGDPVVGWWPAGAIRTHLSGLSGDDFTGHEDIRDAARSDEPGPWAVEHRVGLARHDRTAAEGMLYAVEHLRPTGRVGFAARCEEVPGGLAAETVPFGGEGRRARVHRLDEPGAVDLPDPPEPAACRSGRLLLYLLTPAVFVGGWRPDLADLGSPRLVTAAVAAAQPVATVAADRTSGRMDASSRRLVWAAPAGSVYFLHYDDPAAAERAVARTHGRCLAQVDGPWRTAGFGLALMGRW